MQEQGNRHNSHHALVCLSRGTGVRTEHKTEARKQNKKMMENLFPVSTYTPQYKSANPY